MRCSAPARKGIHFWKLAHTSAHSCGMRRAAAAAARPGAGARPAAPSLPSASRTGGGGGWGTREGSGKTESPGAASRDGGADGVPGGGFHTAPASPRSPSRGGSRSPGQPGREARATPMPHPGAWVSKKLVLTQFRCFSTIQVCLASTLRSLHTLNHLPRHTGVSLRAQSAAGAGCRCRVPPAAGLRGQGGRGARPPPPPPSDPAGKPAPAVPLRNRAPSKEAAPSKTGQPRRARGSARVSRRSVPGARPWHPARPRAGHAAPSLPGGSR